MRLSYELELDTGGLELGDTAIKFAEESLKFECSYPRVIDVKVRDTDKHINKDISDVPVLGRPSRTRVSFKTPSLSVTYPE